MTKFFNLDDQPKIPNIKDTTQIGVHIGSGYNMVEPYISIDGIDHVFKFNTESLQDNSASFVLDLQFKGVPFKIMLTVKTFMGSPNFTLKLLSKENNQSITLVSWDYVETIPSSVAVLEEGLVLSDGDILTFNVNGIQEAKFRFSQILKEGNIQVNFF